MILVRLLLLISFACAAWARGPDWDKPVFKSDALAPTDPRVLDVLKAVCSGDMAPKKADDGLPAVQCQKVCPAYSGFPGETFGMDAVAVTFGHFRSPASDDAVVSTEGCEPHADIWGGSYLLTHVSGRWHLIWYKGGVITEQCRVLALSSARQILLCDNIDGGQGLFWRALYLEDLTDPTHLNSDKLKTIFRVNDSTRSCAGHLAGPDILQPTEEAGITRVDFRGGKKGPQEMTVFAYRSVMNLTDGQIRECEKMWKRSQQENAPLTLPYTIPTNSYEIQFLFYGQSFHIAPASREAAKLFAH